MSTAVLISGQLRTFRQTLPTLHWHVFRKLKDPVFFVSCVDDQQANDAELLRAHYPNVFIERVTQPEFPDADKYLPASQHAPYHISVPPQFILRQAWHLNRVWEFMEERCKPADATAVWKRCQFDAVIRCRPDLWMQGCELGQIPDMWPMECFSPWWGKFAGSNDRFAVMGTGAAYHYFTMFTQIDELLKAGCPFHPESLLLAALEKGHVQVQHTLNAIFSTLRLPEPDPKNIGQFIQQMRPPEILSHEIADYAHSR